VTVFWNSDDVLVDFLEKGTTVNSEHYTETLKNLKTHHKERGRNWYLASTRQCQTSHKCCHNWCHCSFVFTVLPHSAYSQDLAPSDFHLVPRQGITLAETQFLWRSTSCSSKWFWEKEKGFFKDKVQKLVKRWQKFIEVGGDYVEKWLCTLVNKVYRCVYFVVSLKYLPLHSSFS
jgi:hypothetical protein